MKGALRVLLVEDSPDDAELVLRELSRAGYQVDHSRVDNSASMQKALELPWDLVLSDFGMPQFNALNALKLLRTQGLDTPFIIVSGTIGEEVAVEAMRSGANDYVMKGNLRRLGPAVDRELADARARAARTNAERVLLESEERFRRLVESMEDMVYTLDPSQHYDGVFGRWLEKDQREPAEFLGRTAAQIYGPEVGAIHLEANRRALAGEHVVFAWSTGVAPALRHFQTALSPMHDVSGAVTGLVGLSREVTEARRVEATLRLSDRMASLGTLAAGIGHEINNPLTVVMANLDFLQGEFASLNPSADLLEAMKDTVEATGRVRQVVRDLRLLSRADEEKSTVVDLAQVLDSSARMAANEVRHRAVLVRDYQEDVPSVEANESRLGQVFLNLLVNAAQSIPEGRAAHNKITLSLRGANGGAEVEVRDTGRGIPPSVLPRIFDAFFTTKPVGVGTGLGLAICHRIVTGFGGTISVASTSGSGSTFKVFLPGAKRRESLPPLAPSPRAARSRVLVVEDEAVVGAAIQRVLFSSHEVAVVQQGAEALRRLRGGESFDLILCDLMMPEMTGVELHALLQAELPEAASRMAFVTGGVFTSTGRNFVESRSARVLEKPFQSADLIAFVGRLLTEGKPQ